MKLNDFPGIGQSHEGRQKQKNEKNSTLKMDEQKAGNGYSANWHLSAKTNEIATEQLVAEIRR